MRIRKFNESSALTEDFDKSIIRLDLNDDKFAVYIDGKLVADTEIGNIGYYGVLEYLIKNQIDIRDYKMKYVFYTKDGEDEDYLTGYDDEWINFKDKLSHTLKDIEDRDYDIEIK